MQIIKDRKELMSSDIGATILPGIATMVPFHLKWPLQSEQMKVQLWNPFPKTHTTFLLGERGKHPCGTAMSRFHGSQLGTHPYRKPIYIHLFPQHQFNIYSIWYCPPSIYSTCYYVTFDSFATPFMT
jgi:hypothetical protein